MAICATCPRWLEKSGPSWFKRGLSRLDKNQLDGYFSEVSPNTLELKPAPECARPSDVSMIAQNR